ncbi:glycosyltransferase family 2 protein [Aurantivibrio plasticivorans]
MKIHPKNISVVIPAKNEEHSIASVVAEVVNVLAEAQVIVVDDGSDDLTAKFAAQAGAEVISHPYSLGNGAAIKTGARKALGEVLVFMDADGQHRPEDIPRLLGTYEEGYSLVVGARSTKHQASFGRLVANTIYNKLSSWITGHAILDLTSGFRVVNAVKFREFINLLPNGFSYPTTSTMAFFRAGYSVAYCPIEVLSRSGKSHINVWRDGARFLLIIFKVGTLFSPLKLFFPISMAFFCTGLFYYIYTLVTEGRFTNMSALLFSTSVLVFLIGLVSEQITSLLYVKSSQDKK